MSTLPSSRLRCHFSTGNIQHISVYRGKVKCQLVLIASMETAYLNDREGFKEYSRVLVDMSCQALVKKLNKDLSVKCLWVSCWMP